MTFAKLEEELSESTQEVSKLKSIHETTSSELNSLQTVNTELSKSYQELK